MSYTIRDADLERLLIALSELREEDRIVLIRRWARREMKELRAELKAARASPIGAFLSVCERNAPADRR